MFDYLAVLISVVLGLAVTHVLTEQLTSDDFKFPSNA